MGAVAGVPQRHQIVVLGCVGLEPGGPCLVEVGRDNVHIHLFPDRTGHEVGSLAGAEASLVPAALLLPYHGGHPLHPAADLVQPRVHLLGRQISGGADRGPQLVERFVPLPSVCRNGLGAALGRCHGPGFGSHGPPCGPGGWSRARSAATAAPGAARSRRPGALRPAPVSAAPPGR